MAATRLHLALLRHGVESHFICLQQKEPGPNVHELPARGLLRAVQYAITRIVWLIGYLTSERRIIMPNLVPLLTLKRTLRKINPDVVHIHWYMMDTISFGQLGNMPHPVVMTLHDLFDVNIEEPYPASDQRFITGVTKDNSSRCERWLFERKSASMAKLKPFMVGPSRWICDTAQSSIIGRNLHYTIVGNIFDKAFAFAPTQYRPTKTFRILFGANGGRANPKKGWHEIIRAIHFIPRELRPHLEIIIFGESEAAYSEQGIPVRFIGPLSNASQLCNAYQEAELLALPSTEDNAPNVKFEAWLCGLPVVAFNRTGCAEYIEQDENGWIAPNDDHEAFARGIAHFYQRFISEDYSVFREHIAESSARRFGDDAVTRAIIDVYAERTKR